MKSNQYQPRRRIDPGQFPVVVFESDDWGACETVPSPGHAALYRRVLKEFGRENAWADCTLERAEDLKELYEVLASFSGPDGISPVFTAFTSMGNPDYRKIREHNFSEYHDISLEDGFPEPWDSRGVLDAYREGTELGVWSPEYHSMLHHTSPRRWLELLNARTPDGELARKLFDLGIYYQLRHIPEYEGYNIREQFEFIHTGFSRFERLFGRTPGAAVTSDAYPETEMLWAARGARTICLKNCRINSGEVIVYPNKPWNMQDVYAQIGDYQPVLDAVFLTRNVFMEHGTSVEEVLNTVERVWNFHREPAVISTHRCNYCSLDPGYKAGNLKRLAAVLEALCRRGALFLTSGELGDLYRQGWSERKIGNKVLYRKWFDDAGISRMPPGNHLLASKPVPPGQQDHQKFNQGKNDEEKTSRNQDSHVEWNIARSRRACCPGK